MMMDLIPRKDVIDCLERWLKHYDMLLLMVKKDSVTYIKAMSKIDLISHLIVEIKELK